jgi:hypothetical protein
MPFAVYVISPTKLGGNDHHIRAGLHGPYEVADAATTHLKSW